MYFVIEYVDTVTGIEGEALSWEFAKTADEATIKARAHFLLFKARFGAQGHGILSPAGLLLVCGPAVAELDARFRCHRAAPEARSCRGALSRFTHGPHIGQRFGRANFGHSNRFRDGSPKAGCSQQSRCGVRWAGHWRADPAGCPGACKPFLGKALMSERQQSLNEAQVWPASVCLSSRAMGSSLICYRLAKAGSPSREATLCSTLQVLPDSGS